MNPLTREPMDRLLRQLSQRLQWRQRRLQQFADRAGLSLLQVEILLEDKRRAPSLDREIDRRVDPRYQTINQPQ
jgi:hypothetical protein